MENIQFKTLGKGLSAFVIQEGEEKIGEMVVGLSDQYLTAYHTEVVPQKEGKGLAGQLLAAMVDYARQHQLKVIPLCPYVNAQFRRHPDLYEDIWEKERSEPD
ncbi:GNAT family N-acetyltransferase [Larkinella bovis]|uniref:GNAT family N-acetyltransferase n=1 Tax=Larkinella bovis TaxID=683041 RepID=A0ABW0IAL7_9BACT